MFGFVCLQEDALKKCGFDGDSGNTPTPGECAGQQINSPNNACQTCIEAACSAADSPGCTLADNVKILIHQKSKSSNVIPDD